MDAECPSGVEDVPEGFELPEGNYWLVGKPIWPGKMGGRVASDSDDGSTANGWGDAVSTLDAYFFSVQDFPARYSNYELQMLCRM